MDHLKTGTIQLISCLILLLALHSPAEALCPCSGAIASLGSSTNANRDANTTRAIEGHNRTISASTGQITAYLDKLLTGFEKLADGQSMNDAMLSRQEIRAAAESHRYDPAISSCLGMRAVYQLAETDSGEVEDNGEKTTQRIYTYENCAGGDLTVCEGVQEIAKGAIADQQNLGGVAGWPDPTTDIRLLIGDPTIGQRSPSTGDDLEKSVWRLRQNIVNPFPERPPTADRRLQIAGDVELAGYLSENARRSVANSVFALIEGESFPTIPLEQDHIRALIGDNEDLTLTTVSKRHLYELIVDGGYSNPEWHIRLAAATPEALAREFVLQLALANDLAWQNLELDRHRALVEATTLALMLDNQGEPGG